MLQMKNFTKERTQSTLESPFLISSIKWMTQDKTQILDNHSIKLLKVSKGNHINTKKGTPVQLTPILLDQLRLSTIKEKIAIALIKKLHLVSIKAQLFNQAQQRKKGL